jgi:hypothetical protein
LKWQLTAANDKAGITDLETITVTTTDISCDTGTELPGTPTEESSTGNSGLKNLGGGNYQYDWKTSKTYAGTCKRLRLDFGGGAYQTVDFKFR